MKIEQQQRSNKKKSIPERDAVLYEEFEGMQGQELLDDILHRILPNALYLTWQVIEKYQSGNKLSYVGVATIAEKRARSSRKIEKDIARLEELNLLIQYKKPCVYKGRLTYISYKDFTNLYHLAYEYYQWCLSDDYTQYAPQDRCLEAIRQYPNIFKKVVRFENYRRLLLCKKPGRKKIHVTEPLWCDDAPQADAETRTNVLNANIYFPKYFPNHSPYRDSNSISTTIDISNDSSVSTDISNAIENENDEEALRSFLIEEQKGLSPLPEEELAPKQASSYLSEEQASSNNEENSEEDDEEDGQESYDAEVVAPASYKLAASVPSQARERRQQPIPRPAIEAVLTHIMPDLNDQDLLEKGRGKSTITRVLKLAAYSQKDDETFIAEMDLLYKKIRGMPDTGFTQRGRNGKANRMPKFLKYLENHIQQALDDAANALLAPVIDADPDPIDTTQAETAETVDTQEYGMDIETVQSLYSHIHSCFPTLLLNYAQVEEQADRYMILIACADDQDLTVRSIAEWEGNDPEFEEWFHLCLEYCATH